MAVPKQRKTKSRRNQRRMHIHLKKPSLASCPKCKEQKLTHAVCPTCGYYKNREVIDMMKDKKKETPNEKQEKQEKEEKKALTMAALSKKEKK